MVIFEDISWKQPSIDGTKINYKIPKIENRDTKDKRGLWKTHKKWEEAFFLECLDKIHPDYNSIDFFELCFFVENEAIKKGYTQKEENCGNIIRHVGYELVKTSGGSMSKDRLRNRIFGRNGQNRKLKIEIEGKDVEKWFVDNSKEVWKKLYGERTWLLSLYKCWATINDKVETPDREDGNLNRLVVKKEVLDEYNKNAKSYKTVNTDHFLEPKPTKKSEIRYWLVNKDSSNIPGISLGDFVLSRDNGKIVRFDIKDIGGCDIESPISLESGLAEPSDAKSLEKKEFFNLLKPLALVGINFWLVNSSEKEKDTNNNNWQKVDKHWVVPVSNKLKKMPNNNDVLIIRKSRPKTPGNNGVSHIFTYETITEEPSKIDSILNDPPKWGSVTQLILTKKSSTIKINPLFKEEGGMEKRENADGEIKDVRVFKNIRNSEGKPMWVRNLEKELQETGNVTSLDYFYGIIKNSEIWKNLTDANRFNILCYLITAYGRVPISVHHKSDNEKIEEEDGSKVVENSCELEHKHRDQKFCELIGCIHGKTGEKLIFIEDMIDELLENKQIILQGPPGTGKTFIANAISKCLQEYGYGDNQIVQFHTSYSYEEFMEGYKPELDSKEQLKFKIKNGIFKEFCIHPVMNVLEQGELYTKDKLSELFKLNDKARMNKYPPGNYEDRYKHFKKGGRHGSLSTGVFRYDKRFEFNDDSIWLFVIGNKKKGKQPNYKDSYDRKNGILNWQTQNEQKNVSDNEFIRHEKDSRKIYVFYAFEEDIKKNRFEFLGEFVYNSHKELDNEPTSFVFNKKQQSEKKGVFIIDEINRGRTSSIFGELMYLLEYRDEKITLPYSKREFRIPKEVLIIGTMNTADRSIAMVDYALRRRFAFFTLQPNPELFDKKGTKFEIVDEDGDLKEKVKNLIVELNEKIVSFKDRGLGEGYRIGHSYFIKEPGINREQFKRVVKYHIQPLIDEYSQMLEQDEINDLNTIIKKYLK